MKNMYKLTINIKSFSQDYIKNSINYIIKLSKFLKIQNTKIFYLPSKKKKYTLERSPHIDKKSREQFEMIRYKGQIQLRIKSKVKISYMIYFLKNFLFPGIEMQISLQILDFYK